MRLGATATSLSFVLFCSPVFGQANDVERPGYSFLRHVEDWSVLRDVPADMHEDFWDPIKYVSLSDDGEIWASFGGSMRLRTESWWSFGFSDADDRDDTFMLWRALVHADVHFGDTARVFVEGKSALSTDRELPGGKRTLDVDSLDLQQGFLDFNIPIDTASLTLRAGRQSFLFGKQRLVSPLPWANTLRSWDGVTGILKAGDWTVTGFWSQFAPVQKYSFNDPDRHTQFYGAYATTSLDQAYIKGLDLYGLGLANRDDKVINGTVGPEDRYTLGGRVFGMIGDTAIDYDFEGAYQFGRVGDADVSAFMIGTQVGCTVADWWGKPRFALGFEMGSGDDEPGGDVETFNQLFPLGHAYFGAIDTIGRPNAMDLNAGVKFKPVDKLTVDLTGHFFWRESDQDALYNAGGAVVRAGNLGDDSEVGQEIDLTATYKIDQHTTFEFGYSHFFTGDFIEESGPSDDIDFVYVQLNYVF